MRTFSCHRIVLSLCICIFLYDYGDFNSSDSASQLHHIVCRSSFYLLSTLYLFCLCLHVVADFTSISGLLVTFAPDEFEKRITIQTTVDSVVEGTEQFSAVLTSTDDRVTVTEERADISILETGNGKPVLLFPAKRTIIFAKQRH